MTGGCPDRFRREMLCPWADGQCRSDCVVGDHEVQGQDLLLVSWSSPFCLLWSCWLVVVVVLVFVSAWGLLWEVSLVRQRLLEFSLQHGCRTNSNGFAPVCFMVPQRDEEEEAQEQEQEVARQ